MTAKRQRQYRETQSKRQRKMLPHAPLSESKLQQSCVSWFRLQYPQFAKLLFAVPNGSVRPSVITGAILKREGVVSGVSDLILLLPHSESHALCIEMKTPNGHQQPSQKEWQQLITPHGYTYVIIRSVEQFCRVVSDHVTRAVHHISTHQDNDSPNVLPSVT